jgi:hypothetical protein
MVLMCSECRKGFEPPFDSAEFRSWLDAIVEIYKGAEPEWLCLECAGVEFLKNVPKCISIVDEKEK